jgi:hypothetical protein
MTVTVMLSMLEMACHRSSKSSQTQSHKHQLVPRKETLLRRNKLRGKEFNQNNRLPARRGTGGTAVALSLETIGAVDWLVAIGLEGNLASFATSGASRCEHFARASAVAASAKAVLRFVRGAAIRTTSWRIGESLLVMKLLLTRGEHECSVAIAAS